MPKTLLDGCEAFLKAHPNTWLEQFGRQAWRTRLSDLRTQRGMVIENRVRTVVQRGPLLTLAGPRTFRVSEYRYVPSCNSAERA
jgi:hypothetical protein